MGSQNCNGCRSWEEDIYWTHFQFLHFVQFLHSDFQQHLALPKTFSDNLKKKLPENVSFKGPSGVVWSIGLTTRDDTLYFAHGWEQFMKDNSLKENDFLVFKYNGESQFDVLIFDGGSLCEKAGSYFVRKCGHIENVGASLNKRSDTDTALNTDTALEEGNTPSNADVECAPPQKSVYANGTSEPIDVPYGFPAEKTLNTGVESAGAEPFTPDAVTVTLSAVPFETSANKRARKIVSAVKHVQTKRRGRPAKVRERTLEWVSGLEATEAAEAASAVKSTTHEAYTSNRRPVTEDEIKNTLVLAKAASTEESFVVVMRPSHVYRRFFVSMNNKWMGSLVSPTSQDVILRLGKGEWIARYSYHTIRGTGGLSGGWKHFSLDNNLEEYDVCVFTPAGKMNDSLVIDVAIFRVVPEIVPLTAVSHLPSRRGRKSAKKNGALAQT